MIKIYYLFLRMAISDLFSSSFLFSIAIIIILIGGIFAYVSYRMAEQDYKLKQMVDLVSMLARDLQFVKSKLAVTQQNHDIPDTNLEYSSQLMGGQQTSELIDVSDDDSEVDEDDDSEVDEDDDSEVDEDEDHEHSIEDTKIIKLEISQEEIDDTDPSYEEAQNLDFNPEQDLAEFEAEIADVSENTDIKILDMMYHTQPTNIQLEETTINLDANLDANLNDIKHTDELKNISITDLGDIEDFHSSKEYKKMSLNKLREVAVNKGVVSDASKLKKNEILKLLGDE
jgi:hypothetical protein